MKLEEYKEKLKFLETDFKNKKYELNKVYALFNNPYEVGDIATDHMGSIRIEKLDTDTDSMGIPSCVYYGLELKKDLTPTKRPERRHVWQTNLIADKCLGKS